MQVPRTVTRDQFTMTFTHVHLANFLLSDVSGGGTGLCFRVMILFLFFLLGIISDQSWGFLFGWFDFVLLFVLRINKQIVILLRVFINCYFESLIQNILTI